MNFRKILKKIYVLQEVSNQGKIPLLGKGFKNARRINPYNPLSYIVVIILLTIGILCYGVVGIWKEVDLENPFKWR